MQFLFVLIAFILGMLLGKVEKFKILTKYDFLMITTAILLFVMGYEIGDNNKLFAELPSMGLIALKLSVAAVGMSVLLAFFMNFMKGKK